MSSSSVISLEELEPFCVEFLSSLRIPIVIGLIGELGAGKTTFVRNLVTAANVTDPVSSPTYVLQHLYKGEELTIEHWDLYRCTEFPEELVEPPPKNTIRLIEWANKFDLQELGCRQVIHFSYIQDDPTSDRRKLVLEEL